MSQTELICYFFMLLSLIMNADLISLVFSFSIFAYALLEETRPSKTYWSFILVYTILVVMVKYVLQIDLLTLIEPKESLTQAFEPLVSFDIFYLINTLLCKAIGSV